MYEYNNQLYFIKDNNQVLVHRISLSIHYGYCVINEKQHIFKHSFEIKPIGLILFFKVQDKTVQSLNATITLTTYICYFQIIIKHFITRNLYNFFAE